MRIARLTPLLGAALALMVAAAPVAAEDLISQSGTYGKADIADFADGGGQGATCTYENNSSKELDTIKVRGPKVWGNASGKRWVGWRYVIQRATEFEGAFSTYRTSSWVKAKASKTAPVQFATRTWTAPEDPTGFFRVRVQIRWYEPGSSTKVMGRMTLQDAWYKVKRGSKSAVHMGQCQARFSLIQS